MGATCQNCPIASDYIYSRNTPIGFVTPQATPFGDPDFYNDITRAKALELGEFKYNNDEKPGIYKGPILMEDGCKYIGQFYNGVRSGRGRQVWPDFSLY